LLVSDSDAHSALQQDGDWRTAVWSLRVGYLGLAVGIGGLIVVFAGSTRWVLAAGVIIWLAAAALTLAEFFRVTGSATGFLVDAVHAHPRLSPPTTFAFVPQLRSLTSSGRGIGAAMGIEWFPAGDRVRH
jgi:hypothetical protein